MTPDQVADLFSFLGASYPRWNVTPATINAYAVGLADCDAEAVWRAVQHHQREAKWEPTVAEIRSLIQQHSPDRSLPTADEAWLEFHKAWKASSQFDSPPADDAWSTPLVAVAARRIPAWHALRSASSEDMKWHAKEFRAAYTEALSRRRFDETAEAVRTLPLPRGLAALTKSMTKELERA